MTTRGLLPEVTGDALAPRLICTSSALLPNNRQAENPTHLRSLRNAHNACITLVQQHQRITTASRFTTGRATGRLATRGNVRASSGPSLPDSDSSGRQASDRRQSILGSSNSNPLAERKRLTRQTPYPKFFLGIETEFLLRGRDAVSQRSDIISFLTAMADRHNKTVQKPCAQMDAKGDDDDLWMGQLDCSWWIVMEEKKLMDMQEILTPNLCEYNCSFVILDFFMILELE